jgi:hypothetical protein
VAKIYLDAVKIGIHANLATLWVVASPNEKSTERVEDLKTIMRTRTKEFWDESAADKPMKKNFQTIADIQKNGYALDKKHPGKQICGNKVTAHMTKDNVPFFTLAATTKKLDLEAHKEELLIALSGKQCVSYLITPDIPKERQAIISTETTNFLLAQGKHVAINGRELLISRLIPEKKDDAFWVNWAGAIINPDTQLKIKNTSDKEDSLIDANGNSINLTDGGLAKLNEENRDALFNQLIAKVVYDQGDNKENKYLTAFLLQLEDACKEKELEKKADVVLARFKDYLDKLPENSTLKLTVNAVLNENTNQMKMVEVNKKLGNKVGQTLRK